ncbi:UDP-N-acetylmuramoyl-tripeptide--D-alanyl-D-alanine ligase [Paenibacillus silviterrae]|uniref:UDP-N-acetylmuramoyl-tripeptide--D-alanyl-D- alanine ligase n=1 Tax=Paenibacillus silviterrae TaxID=3242194 RepID=UPI00254298C9|nr:UDP-N-acetylmuramoyl-tripeptide--D-alanyl-D-alanine ligase [Paenibacillus chinjuensis]
MISHKLKVIEQMVEGNGLSGEYEELLILGVSIDSRSVQSGNLFIPIIRQLEGHDYVEEAITKGAMASLWQKDHPNPPVHLPLIYVDDCLESLQMLAANYRKELPIKVIGITGSNGKTTTKDMISSVLETKYRVHKTVGNLNSQIGLPLTILEIDKSTEVAVVEMGMSERGQMGRLSLIAKPDIAVITMIGVSHLSSLGSREEIAAAKLEIIDGLQDNGILIYNGDEPLLTNRVKSTKNEKPICTTTFGHGEDNDFYFTNKVTQQEGSLFTVEDNNFFIPLLGAHNVINAVATIAVATKMGLSPTEIDMGFQSLRVTSMRMEKILSTLGFTIINDAWNASPISMSAAIKTFEELTGYSRKHLVLGDMLELGEQEQEFHRDIGRMIDPVKIDFVYTVGKLSKYIASEAEKRFPVGGVQAFNDKKELAQVLKNRVLPNDAIMLKGSRGVQLESVLPNLL